MSSEPPGRYQSRLFNFLNRQSLRLTDRLERAVRQLKVAAVWGAQILIYPAYLLVQASLSVGRQLSTAAQAGWPQLQESTTQEPQETPPSADTPIQRVLSEVNTLELQVEQLKVRSFLAQHRSSYEDIAQVESLDQSSTRQLTTSSNLPLRGTLREQPSNLDPSNLPLQGTLREQSSTQTNLNPTASESSEERYLIQGVASLLATRTLVLVTVHNEILDILTPLEQQKLSSRISVEVAVLLHQRRIAQKLNPKKATPQFTTLDQPRVFLPVRLFWKVMGWVQTSPVAIAANLFQESTLVDRLELKASSLEAKSFELPSSTLPSSTLVASNNQEQSIVKSSNIRSLTPVQGALAFLDRTVAELESHQLVPGSEVVMEIALRAKSVITKRTQNLLQPLKKHFTTSGDLDASSDEVSQTNKFQIQALIYAAVDYFFGRQGSNLPGAGSQEQSKILANPHGEAHQLSGRHSTAQPPAALPPNSELGDAGEPDPWLTWGDLFESPDGSGKAQKSKVQFPNRQSQAQLPEAFNSKIAVRLRNSILGVIKRYLSFKPSPGKLSAPSEQKPRVESPESVVQIVQLTDSKKTQSLQTQGRQKDKTSKQLKTLSPKAASSRGTSVSPAKPATTAITTSSSNTDLEPAHDWIETPATPTGYVKHPLEQLLGYVDLGMHWLEEIAVKVWRWVQHLGRRG